VIPPRSAHTSLRGRRKVNEDAIVEKILPDGGHLLAVADGIGGHRSGEIASTMATEALATELAFGRTLLEASLAANRAVFEASILDPDCAGMGTTLVAVLSSGSAYQIVSVGDSRAYRVDRKGISQITSDHSFMAEATRDGHLSPEEIRRSPWRNALTRSFGTGGDVEVDVFGPFERSAEPHAILLCTDGLHGVVPDSAIRDGLLSSPDPAEAVRRLAALAMKGGSRDNISVAVLEFGQLLGRPAPAQPPGSTRKGTGPDAGASDLDPSRRLPALPLVAATAVRPEPTRKQGSRGTPRASSRRVDRRIDQVLLSLAVSGLVLWFVLMLLQS
jgi:PPM family protein phosphatase